MDNLTKLQFDCLCYAKGRNGLGLQKKKLASELFKDLGEINEAFTFLEDEGFIKGEKVTEKAEQYLDIHKVENAIILAAGMSTRFAPINFEKPKGLLEVKGERLIERQIRQLKDVGISEIIIVIGYMKEEFTYLVDKYGVVLVEAPDYAIKNNYASVWAARDYLSNTLITSSDLYFSKNLFQKYAFDSYYCTVYVQGKTPERGVITDSDDRILKTMYGDKCYDIWVTLGYAFFNKRFSENYKRIVEPIFDLPETANKFWADIQDDHYDDLYMYAKRCNSEDIHEFDSLEELRLFDETYLDNSGSELMNSISGVLGVKESELTSFQFLRDLSKPAFRFVCKGNPYIFALDQDKGLSFSYQGRNYTPCLKSKMNNAMLYKMDGED